MQDKIMTQKIAKKSTENVEKLKCLETTLTKRKYFATED
jgi:hypothetical protein